MRLVLPGPADTLREYERFLGSLCRCGHVCLAVQPDSVHGSPETLVAEAIPDAAEITGGWADRIVDAMGGVQSETDVIRVLDTVSTWFDLGEFADLIEEQILRGAMLGALDSDWEHEHDAEIAPATFKVEPAVTGVPFADIPFDDAVKLFESKKILDKATFEALHYGAKRKAFTVAGLASQELLATAHAELLRQLKNSEGVSYKDPQTGKWVYKGPNWGEFKKFVKQRLESAGWTPANPSHVETIYRTNVATAYSSGRFIETTQPAVMAALPYWQIKAVGDDRTRKTHKAANGVVLPANHQFWLHAYPPFGYCCRCRVVARSKGWIDRNSVSIGPVPKGLPDPGFDSGTKALISVPVPKPQPKPAPKVAPKPPSTAELVPTIPTLPIQKAPAPKTPPPLPAAPSLQPSPLPPSNSAQNILHKQLAGPGGSNPGGLYEGADGVKRYVKLYKDPGQAYSEHLANQIYSDLGLGKIKSVTFQRGQGAVGYASEYMDGVKTLRESGLTPELAKKALDGFVGDVLTANWDAAGLDLDNLVVDKKGRIYRIDNGGTFLSRAQGARKPVAYLNAIEEFEKLLDPHVNPAYSALAQKAGVTKAADMLPQIKAGLKKAKAVAEKAGGWASYVEQHGAGLTAQDKFTISGMLEKRTALIEERIAQIEAANATAPVTTRVFEELKARDLTNQGMMPAKRNADGTTTDVAPITWKKRARERCRKLTEDEKFVIIDYVGDGYSSMRDVLRMTKDEWVREYGRFLTHGDLNHAYNYRKNQAEVILGSFRTAQNVDGRGDEQDVDTIYRGFSVADRAVFDRILNAKYAQTETFSSFSWRHSTAKGFATRKGEWGITLVVKARPGATSRLAIEGLSDVEEAEILVDRGVKYRVTDVARDSAHHKHAYIYLEELEENAQLPAGDLAKLTIG